MKAATFRELKNKTSELLRQAARDDVMITPEAARRMSNRPASGRHPDSAAGPSRLRRRRIQAARVSVAQPNLKDKTRQGQAMDLPAAARCGPLR